MRFERSCGLAQGCATRTGQACSSQSADGLAIGGHAAAVKAGVHLATTLIGEIDCGAVWLHRAQIVQSMGLLYRARPQPGCQLSARPISN